MPRPELPPEIIKARKETVVAALKDGASYRKAIEAAKLSSQTAAKWRENDLVFDEIVSAYLTGKPRAYAHQGKLPSRSHEKVPQDERADIIEQICNAIRGGLPVDMCCLLVNINKGALVEWMARDPEIQAKVNKAQAQNLLWWISKLREGASRDWRAAIAYLERVFPHLFAEVKAVDVSVRTEDKQQNMVIDVTPEHVLRKMMEMSDDDLLKIAGMN